MGTPYSSVSVTGYNSSPPADDGSTDATNQVKWSIIKTKLPDPLKTAIEAINTALVATLSTAVNSKTANYTTVAGDHLKTVEAATSVSTAVTFSLGDAVTMGSIYIVQIKNSGSSTLTVGRATSSDTIDGAEKNLALGPKQSAIFSTSGAGYICLTGNPPIYDATDPSKSVRFDVSGVTTGTQRALTVPDRSGTIATLSGDQTFTGANTHSGAQTFSGEVTTQESFIVDGSIALGSNGLIVSASTSLGTISTGTVTPNPQAGPYQHYTNNGAHTLAPSSNKGSVVVEITNGASAGAITTSGFTRVVGSPLTTTNTHKFVCTIIIHQNCTILSVQAAQS